MIGWLIRILLVLAGFITSIFVARDELHFEIVQMVVAVLLFTLFIMIIAFWPMLKKGFMRRIKKDKHE